VRGSLVTSLIVSGLAMLMLFTAMGLLYGLMLGLTVLIRGHSPSLPKDKDAPLRSPKNSEAEQRRTAAAIAVALARAEQDVTTVDAPEIDTAISGWWTLHHQRQLTHSRCRVRSGNRS